MINCIKKNIPYNMKNQKVGVKPGPIEVTRNYEKLLSIYLLLIIIISHLLFKHIIKESVI